MSDQFTEIATTSWFSRIAGSISGMVFGLILFAISFPLIWWNEGRSVDRIKTLNEARNLVQSVAADTVDANYQNALIHISGKATTNDIIKDEMFGVEENALKIHRKVEMYQWEETSKTTKKKNVGGSETSETVYSYNKKWSESLIDSSTFRKAAEYQNPSTMPFSSHTTSSPNVTVGAFNLSDRFIKKITAYEPYSLSQDNFDAANSDLKRSYKLSSGQFYKGDPAMPQVGNVRITFQIVKPHTVSVIGKQNDATIETYVTRTGQIDLLETGHVGAEGMISTAESANAMLTWILRLVGFILMWLGLKMFLAPVKVLSDVVPLFGTIVGAGIGLVTGLVTFALSFLTIAVAWIFFRPVIGGALLVLSIGAAIAGYRLIAKNKSASASPTQTGEPSAAQPHPAMAHMQPSPPAQAFMPNSHTPHAQPAQAYAHQQHGQPAPHYAPQHQPAQAYAQQAQAPQAYAPPPEAPAQHHTPQQPVPPAHTYTPQAPAHPASPQSPPGYAQQAYAPQPHAAPVPQAAPQTPAAPTPPARAAKKGQPVEFVPQPYIPPTPTGA